MNDTTQGVIVGAFSILLTWILGEIRHRSSEAVKQKKEAHAKNAADYQAFMDQVFEQLAVRDKRCDELQTELDRERKLRRKTEDDLAQCQRQLAGG